jgi:hypothetical protein
MADLRLLEDFIFWIISGGGVGGGVQAGSNKPVIK